MRLVNINVGIKINNSEKIAEYVKTTSPDIVAFQEVVRHLDESVFPLFRSLSDITAIIGGEYPHKFFGPLWASKGYTKNGKMHKDFGGLVEQGNAVWSKLPIVGASNEHFYGTYTLAIDWTNWEKEDHGRALIVSELTDANGKPFQVLNLHGIWTKDKLGDERTIKECEYVLNASLRKSIPTIITGDFNLFPETPSIQILNKHYRNLISEYKVTTTRPDFKDNIDVGLNVVDYVFVNEGIKVNTFEVPHSDISDHLPLVLDFELV